jgi:hypothetical protein
MAHPAAIEMFLGRLPADLAASFSPAQLDAVALHFAMRHRPRHAIDWRHRVALPFARFYVILLAGREHRAE